MLAGIREGECFLARAIINYDAGDGNSKPVLISGCSPEKGADICCQLLREDVSKADAGGIIDTDMNIFPTDSPAIGLALVVLADAVAYPVEARQHLDIQMDQLARMFAQLAPQLHALCASSQSQISVST